MLGAHLHTQAQLVQGLLRRWDWHAWQLFVALLPPLGRSRSRLAMHCLWLYLQEHMELFVGFRALILYVVQ
jgi:hypothetical protein